MAAELAKSPYLYLFKDENFKRWYQNVKRGSANTAYEWFRRMGRIHKRFSVLPNDLVNMGEKKAVEFLMDMVTQLEAEKMSGSYIANNVNASKELVVIQHQPADKDCQTNELVTVADERVPTQEELAKIFSAGLLRAKAAALIAFSGLRPESLGDAEGEDGLMIQDIPEMVIGNSKTDKACRIQVAAMAKFGIHYKLLHAQIYIPPSISLGMVVARKPLRATTSRIGHLLHLNMRCSCGHKKEYHVNGKSRCVFGMCDCKKFNEPIVNAH